MPAVFTGMAHRLDLVDERFWYSTCSVEDVGRDGEQRVSDGLCARVLGGEVGQECSRLAGRVEGEMHDACMDSRKMR